MNGIKIQQVEMLLLLWALPALAGLLLYASRKRKRDLAVFADTDVLQRLKITADITARRWKNFFFLAALALIALGLSRPGWKPVETTIERRGRDVVFLLDVSKSMLAEDLAPNRLERAKLAISDCVARLKGERVGLITFAGSATVLCPLTTDHGFFRMILDDVSVESVPRGGTMIGDAIRKALDDIFDDKEMKFKDIILITDGEDHGSFPLEAAEQAGNKGIRLIVIGIGDEKEGARIPVVDTHGNRRFLTYDGHEVWAKLDADTLREMAKMTPDGVYFNVATGDIDLGSVYEKLIESAENREIESQTITRYQETFQAFLAGALTLLFIEFLISDRKKEDNAP